MGMSLSESTLLDSVWEQNVIVNIQNVSNVHTVMYISIFTFFTYPLRKGSHVQNKKKG